jgi:hypothetical protein
VLNIYLLILIMPKRKHTNTTLEVIGLVFNQIFATASQMDPDLPEGTTPFSHTQQLTEYLRQLKSQILSEAA